MKSHLSMQLSGGHLGPDKTLLGKDSSEHQDSRGVCSLDMAGRLHWTLMP